MRDKFIYMGMRLNHLGQKRYAYKKVTDTDLIDETVSFGSRLARMESVGNVVSSVVDGSTYKDSQMEPPLPSSHPATEHITHWDAENRAALARFQMNSAAKKPHPESIDAAVEKIRGALGGFNARERATIALQIYQKLIR